MTHLFLFISDHCGLPLTGEIKNRNHIVTTHRGTIQLDNFPVFVTGYRVPDSTQTGAAYLVIRKPG